MEFSKEQALLAIDRERVPICTASDQVWKIRKRRSRSLNLWISFANCWKKKDSMWKEILLESLRRFPEPMATESRSWEF